LQAVQQTVAVRGKLLTAREMIYRYPSVNPIYVVAGVSCHPCIAKRLVLFPLSTTVNIFVF